MAHSSAVEQFGRVRQTTFRNIAWKKENVKRRNILLPIFENGRVFRRISELSQKTHGFNHLFAYRMIVFSPAL